MTAAELAHLLADPQIDPLDALQHLTMYGRPENLSTLVAVSAGAFRGTD